MRSLCGAQEQLARCLCALNMQSSRACCAGLPVDSKQLRKGGANAVSCMGSSVFGFRDFLLKSKVSEFQQMDCLSTSFICLLVVERLGEHCHPSAAACDDDACDVLLFLYLCVVCRS